MKEDEKIKEYQIRLQEWIEYVKTANLELDKRPYLEFKVKGGQPQVWLRIGANTTLKDTEKWWKVVKLYRIALKSLSPSEFRKIKKYIKPKTFSRNVRWLFYKEELKFTYGEIVDRTLEEHETLDEHETFEEKHEIFDADTVRMAVTRLKKRMIKNPVVKKMVESYLGELKTEEEKKIRRPP